MAGAGFKTFTAGSILTASDVNTYLQEQSVMYFATTTARDAAITSPSRGMVAYVGSNDSSEGLYTYNGTAWRKGPGWNAPWGVMGVSKKTTTTTTNGGVITSVTFTAVGNRYYRISGLVPRSGSTSNGDLLTLQVRNGATVLAQAQQRGDVLGSYYFLQIVTYDTPSAGSVTYDLYGARTGAGNSEFVGAATEPVVLIIEDMGPNGAPA